MASKVWDDLSMWNVDFSHVCPSFDLQRVNALELTMLEALRYFIKVSAGEYAKYYFLLRSMVVKLGVGQGLGVDLVKGTAAGMIKPLDIAGARKLQIITETYQETKYGKEPADGSRRGRSATIHMTGFEGQAAVESLRLRSEDSYDMRHTHSSVGLEQITHALHVDADGVEHTTPAVARYRSLREFDRQKRGFDDRTLRRVMSSNGGAEWGTSDRGPAPSSYWLHAREHSRPMGYKNARSQSMNALSSMLDDAVGIRNESKEWSTDSAGRFQGPTAVADTKTVSVESSYAGHK